jgi:hypothetical protein
MTAVENKLMMILMRLALLDSASSELSRRSSTTRQDSQCDQGSKIKSPSLSDMPQTRGEKVNDTKPT